MTSTRCLPFTALAAALLLAAASPADAQRLLHWRELGVQARLESDGTLAVSETHAMVFTGDWNGGERSFRVRLGQQLQLDGIYRRDPPVGAWVPLARGSLDDLDRWDWTDRSTLRWRSRLPSDPPFEGTEIDYRLDYRLSGILHREGDGWLLDHDFAFADRAGNITRFVLDLELAPEWEAAGALPRHLEEGPLFPGEGRVVTARLRYVGAGTPARATVPRPAPAVVLLVVGLTALGVAGLLRWAVARERSIGRLAPPPSLDLVDREWLEKRVFSLAPEEVGAAWDDSIGSAEVAAMLARMQLQGKLASRVEEQRVLFTRKPNLRLTLLADRAQLPQAERQLVDGLFPSGNETDTASLRKHYARSGFDPAAKIAATVEAGLLGRRGFASQRPHPPRGPSAALVLLGLAGLGAALLLSPASWPALLALAIALLVLWIPAFAAAMALRPRIVDWRGPLAVVSVSELAALVALGLAGSLPSQSYAALLGGGLLLLGLARTVATAMQSRQGEETIARRLELAAARRWFQSELERPEPKLEDSWAPYLIAFGLAPQMDGWWRSFGGASAATAGTRGGGWSTSGGAGGGWTGGGGSFGGAGATASWAMAATSMSAGVAAASSGGGGGGGGGSSGGGGGGGW